MYINVRSIIYVFHEDVIYQNKKYLINPDKYNIRYMIISNKHRTLFLRIKFIFLGLLKCKKYKYIKEKDLLIFLENLLKEYKKIYYIDQNIDRVKYINQHKKYTPDILLAMNSSTFLKGNFNFF